jgi:hypothetical protein
MEEVRSQCNGGPLVYGGIAEGEDLRRNLQENAIPLALYDNENVEYGDFLAERRQLISNTVRGYYFSL